MTSGGIRRTQLISPFGVGAMTVLVDGSSVVTGGLDHWFDGEHVQVAEFKLDEWRLAQRLRVDHFRLPPDYRTSGRTTDDPVNLRLTVPFLRFPSWSFCPYCKRLSRRPLAFQGRDRCEDPKHGDKGRKPVTAQVPFVSVCDQGHVDDFPWSEWVHRSTSPACTGVLRLKSTGGGTLAGQVVACDGCGKSRNLLGVTNASGTPDARTTVLTSQLAGGDDEFRCGGHKPWLGDERETCGRPVRASLRGASNVYFPLVESSIYLPQPGAPEKLLAALRRPQFATLKLLHKGGLLTPASVREIDEDQVLQAFSDAELQQAFDQMYGGGGEGGGEPAIDDQTQAEWRRPEFEYLRETLNHPDLRVSEPGGRYGDRVTEDLGRLRLVETLRETRALWGFTRLTSAPVKLNEGKERLWKHMPPPPREWLPAYEVRGEGLYIELPEPRLQAWERSEAVQARARMIEERYGRVQADRGLQERGLPPRFVLLHTLAHLLINQLIFECGYGSASLRERLYVSAEPGKEMAGLLLYTAAGDSEGTMGGLVRMGKPGYFDGVWDAALGAAGWCSTDPICMEAGESGQGPDSCNLAACHACALLPETSCEEFNRFLDRGLVVGSLKDPELAYFSAS